MLNPLRQFEFSFLRFQSRSQWGLQEAGFFLKPSSQCACLIHACAYTYIRALPVCVPAFGGGRPTSGALLRCSRHQFLQTGTLTFNTPVQRSRPAGRLTPEMHTPFPPWNWDGKLEPSPGYFTRLLAETHPHSVYSGYT